MWLRPAILAIVFWTGLMPGGRAQEAGRGSEQQPIPLPQIVIGGDRKNAAAGIDRCVEVQIGPNRALDCINQNLKQKVDGVNPPTLNIPPIDARSPDTKVGIINLPAVQQQYGKNFGISAYPYRPPPPTYTAPTGHR